jgi:hypothetical protein
MQISNNHHELLFEYSVNIIIKFKLLSMYNLIRIVSSHIFKTNSILILTCEYYYQGTLKETLTSLKHKVL